MQDGLYDQNRYEKWLNNIHGYAYEGSLLFYSLSDFLHAFRSVSKPTRIGVACSLSMGMGIFSTMMTNSSGNKLRGEVVFKDSEVNAEFAMLPTDNLDRTP